MPFGSSRNLIVAIALLAALASLHGCDRQEAPPAGDAGPASAPAPANGELPSELETFERQAGNCTDGEDCASVSVTREVFAQQPALNAAVMDRLIAQLQGSVDGPATTSGLEEVANQFLSEAAAIAGASGARWLLSGEARQLSRHGELLTVEITTYRYTGGAHGTPSVEWLNWDLSAGEHISLQQVLREGTEQDFWEHARAAHGRWLEQQSGMDPQSREMWSFQRSGDFRFSDDGLILLYGVYALGPYAMGPVQLTIPWQDLAGVIREPYLPSR